jgi:CheY-like chemotaxis protein
MKIFATIVLLIFSVANTQAQLLKKLKQKAEDAITKPKDKPEEKKQADDKEKTVAAETGNTKDPKSILYPALLFCITIILKKITLANRRLVGLLLPLPKW